MIVIVTRTEKITTQVDLSEAVYKLTDGNPPKSWAKLGEIAIDQAKFQIANNQTIDYPGDGWTFKIQAMV